jgi:uncharacterized protein involved in tellurium resistance
MKKFTIVCDFDGGTYVSQLESLDAVGVAREWSAMIRAERPIPRTSTKIADNVVIDLDNGTLPSALDGLKNVWQILGHLGNRTYTATIVQSD